MAKSDYILQRLGDFWRRFKEQDVLKGFWDGLIEIADNIRLNLHQINQGKGLFTVPVNHRSSPVLFKLDSTTKRTTPPEGYAAAYNIDSEITSIPAMTSGSDETGTILVEGIAYDVTSAGVIAFRAVPPALLFANDVLTDRKTIYKNFGFPIDFQRETSESYKRRIQGLWYALWNGGAVGNIRLGMHILAGLPFVQSGTVLAVDQNEDGSYTINVDGELYHLPSFLNPAVLPGQVITNFTALSDGADVFDHINNPEFFETASIGELQKFFTFIPVILAEAIIAEEVETGEIFDYTILTGFLDRIRPAYTNYVVGIKAAVETTLQIYLDSTLIEYRANLGDTVDINPVNYFELEEPFETLNGITLDEYNAHLTDFPNFDLDTECIGFAESLEIRDFSTDEVLVTV